MATAAAAGNVVSDLRATSLQARSLGWRRIGNSGGPRQRRRLSLISASSAAPYGPGAGGGSEIVDANMDVLRKRIHRLRSLEAVEGFPDDWMDWEKACYPSYRADVAYLMAGVQSQLLGLRPSLSLFVISVILSAMPVGSLLMLRFILQLWVPHS